MDVWHIVILAGAAFVAVRSLLNLAVSHEVRHRRRRKRELKRAERRENERATREAEASANTVDAA